MNLGSWKSTIIRTNPKAVLHGFGHDFRDCEFWIVEVSSGRQIARIAPTLTRQEAEQVGRVIRQAPVLTDACHEAVRRLAKAQHPNAKSLRELILGALRGLEIPFSDELSDRIDP